jgi:hypothetical protein
MLYLDSSIAMKYSELLGNHSEVFSLPMFQKIGDKYPLVNKHVAIENGHRNSEFSHEKW